MKASWHVMISEFPLKWYDVFSMRFFPKYNFVWIIISITQNLFSFIANGQTSYQSQERSFVRYIEFALFGSVTTTLAGSAAFVVSREYMRSRNRYNLFIITFVLTIWSFINDFLLALLHCGLIAAPRANITLPETSKLSVNYNQEDNWSNSLTGPAKDSPESIVQAQNLQKALLISFFIVVVFLAISSVLVGHNLIVGFNEYRRKPDPRRMERSGGASVGSIESNMNAVPQERTRKNSIDFRTYPVTENSRPLLVSLDSWHYCRYKELLWTESSKNWEESFCVSRWNSMRRSSILNVLSVFVGQCYAFIFPLHGTVHMAVRNVLPEYRIGNRKNFSEGNVGCWWKRKVSSWCSMIMDRVSSGVLEGLDFFVKRNQNKTKRIIKRRFYAVKFCHSKRSRQISEMLSDANYQIAILL